MDLTALQPSEDVEPILEALRQMAVPGKILDETIPIQAGALFARLKAINRASTAAARLRKQHTAEARHAISQTHLGLQNLMYERRHLEREIEKCRQFASAYQDIPIHPLDEFRELAPDTYQTPEILADEHQLMLNRLEFELSERKRLEEERKTLMAARDKVLKESKEYQNQIDALAERFDALTKMTVEIQKTIHQLAPTPLSPPSPSSVSAPLSPSATPMPEP
ncbi:hypothetical protein FRC03_004979 [Tulasnella sp. 419]|nr:hypothetical protein FRC02_003536 [Tulasnella sp. 418]KAG8969012.1 hypothetical protein FRC03_004979 [Tulasnella sp. 419]